MLKVDVAVVGGGSAGLAAAVAAARSGARTVLIERAGALGGMATGALVHSICGLYLLRDAPGAVLANPGFASELALRLLRAGGARGPVRLGRVDVLLHDPPALAWIADALVGSIPELELRLHSEVIETSGDGRLEGVDVWCRGARELVLARAFVDATGDATLAALAGAAFEQEPGDRLQRPAFIFTLHGIEADALSDGARLRAAHRMVSAVRAGTLPSGALGATLRPSGRPGEVMVTIDLPGPTGVAYDPLDPACLTALEVEGRRLACALADYVRSDLPGFGASYLAALPARVGIRESRRVVGHHRIEASDVLTGARFDDAVALGTWPIELRETTSGARLRFPDAARPYDIPLRALCARDVDNLFVAGRCISASHAAQASARVIGTCLATGEAAGLAAALHALQPAARACPIMAADVLAARARVMLPHSERAAHAA